MSKLHVVAGNGGGYQTFIHTNMPAGANLVGNSWSACYVAAYAPVTQMSIGTSIGQITSSEAASIALATVLEFKTEVAPNADGTAPSSTALDAMANIIISSGFNALQAQLKYFGYTQ